MKRMKPSPTNFYLLLQYSCPNCGEAAWRNHLESQIKGFKIMCESCRMAFEIEAVEGAILKFGRKILSSGAVEVGVESTALSVIRTQGYSKREGVELIKRAKAKHGFIPNVGRLVQLSIREVVLTIGIALFLSLFFIL